MINSLIKVCIYFLTFMFFAASKASDFQDFQQGPKKVVFLNLRLGSVTIDKSNLRNFNVTFPGYMGLRSKTDVYTGCILIATFEPLAFEEDYGYVLIDKIHLGEENTNREIGRINLRGYKEDEILKWRMFFDIRNPLNRSFTNNSLETVLYQREVTFSYVPMIAIMMQIQNPCDPCVDDSDTEYLKNLENYLYGFRYKNMGQPNENEGILFTTKNISEDSQETANNKDGCCTIQ